MKTPFTQKELHEKFEECREMQKRIYNAAVKAADPESLDVARRTTSDLLFSYENEVLAYEKLNRLMERAAPKII